MCCACAVPLAPGLEPLQAQRPARQFGAFDTSANLRERDLTRGGRIVSEWREAAVVGRAKLIGRNELRRFQHAVADNVSSLDPEIRNQEP